MRRSIRGGLILTATLMACSSGKSETREIASAPAAPATPPPDAQVTKAQPPPVAPAAAGTAPAPVTTSAAPAASTEAPAPGTQLAAAASAPAAAAPIYTPAANLPPEVLAILKAGDRTDADKALDAGRKPGETLAFFDLKPGMKVGEIGAGGGYTTELLARAVGPQGTVYAQNAPVMIEKVFKTSWPDRLRRPINAKVIRADREFDAPFPDDAKDLDAVVINAIYHDTVWIGVDRKAMNAAVFAALKPGGKYFVIDSSAKEGTGLNDVKTLHRIDEAAVKSEVEAAGFKLEKSGDFLRNPSDTRDWSASPREAGEKRGTGDRFALEFVKPMPAPAKHKSKKK